MSLLTYQDVKRWTEHKQVNYRPTVTIKRLMRRFPLYKVTYYVPALYGSTPIIDKTFYSLDRMREAEDRFMYGPMSPFIHSVEVYQV